MNKLDIAYLIETLEAAERDISPYSAEKPTSTRDIANGRKRISFALNHLRFLRDGNPSVAPFVGEKESPVDAANPSSLSEEDRHRRLEILKACGNLATAKHWEAWITGTSVDSSSSEGERA